MRIYTAVIEKCTDTGLYVGFVPGFSGAHTQGETLDELNDNLKEVIALLLEDGEPRLETEFVVPRMNVVRRELHWEARRTFKHRVIDVASTLVTRGL